MGVVRDFVKPLPLLYNSPTTGPVLVQSCQAAASPGSSCISCLKGISSLRATEDLRNVFVNDASFMVAQRQASYSAVGFRDREWRLFNRGNRRRWDRAVGRPGPDVTTEDELKWRRL